MKRQLTVLPLVILTVLIVSGAEAGLAAERNQDLSGYAEDVYTIQAGAFESFDNAIRNFNKVADMPYARVEKREGNYVLRLGKFTGLCDAGSLLKRTRAIFKDAFIRKTTYQEERIVLPMREAVAQAETEVTRREAVREPTIGPVTKDAPKEEVSQNSPGKPPAGDVPTTASLRQQGLSAEAEGRWQDALIIYREILVKEPADADLWMRVAEIEEQSGNDVAAATDFQKAADLSPNSGRAFSGLSRAYASLEKPREAFVAIERAVQLEPDNVQYLQARAAMASWIAEYAVAVDSYQRLMRLTPEDDSLLLKMARVESWMGANDRSSRFYREFLKKHPDNGEALLELVQVESWRGNYSESLNLLEKFRQQEGVTDDYLNKRARVLAEADRPRAALEINDPLLLKTPEDYDLNHTNSVALHYGNRFDEAVKSLAILERLKPEAKETDDARRFVMTSLRSFVEAGFHFYHDTDSLNKYQSYLKGSYQLNPDTQLTAAVMGDELHAHRGSGLEKADGQEDAWHSSVQGGIVRRFSPDVAANAYVGAASTEGHATVPYGLGADFRFIDALSFKVERNFGFYVDSPRTLSLGIRRGVDHISAQWTPDVNYTVAMMAGYNDYSDGNTQWEATLSPRRAVFRTDKINLDIGLSLERQGFRERLDSNGYYSPRLYQRYTVQTLWYWKMNDDNGISLGLGYGIQKDETFGGFRQTYDANLEGTFGIYRDWMLKVDMAAFHSLRVSGPYSAFSAGAALTRRF